MFTIYTDGSTKVLNKRGADNSGGFGYVVFDDFNNVIDAFSQFVNNTTNNEMELAALVSAIREYGLPEESWNLNTIYSDSQYAINCLTVWADNWRNNNWTRQGGLPIENLEFIQTGYKLLHDGYHCINIKYIKGHSGILGNELADRLATGELSPSEVLERYGFND